MKKTIVILVFLLSCSFIGKAQAGFIGGGFTLFYSDGLLYQTTIHGGYEFNDKMAVMAMTGIAYGYGSVVGEVGTYFRFTPWHNNIFFLDIKPTVEMAFSDYISALDIGVIPSMRFRCSEHWEVFTDIGAVGVRYLDGDWMPRIGVTNMTATVGASYRF